MSEDHSNIGKDFEGFFDELKPKCKECNTKLTPQYVTNNVHCPKCGKRHGVELLVIRL